jgi:hypothetical protein
MSTHTATSRLAACVLAALLAGCNNSGSRNSEGPRDAAGVAPGNFAPQIIIRALVIEGQIYPSDQFDLASADRCDDFHWHKHDGPALSIGTPAAGGNIVCATSNRATRTDPNPGACGFGKISELPSTEWRTTQECFRAWQAAELAGG